MFKLIKVINIRDNMSFEKIEFINPKFHKNSSNTLCALLLQIFLVSKLHQNLSAKMITRIISDMILMKSRYNRGALTLKDLQGIKGDTK